MAVHHRDVTRPERASSPGTVTCTGPGTITGVMDENEITQRLRDAGDQPVPGEVRATHLSQMHAAVPVVEKPKRFGRLAVAAAAFVGFAVGSTGFAMAGALPAPAQEVAHDVLSVVQVNVPDGEYKNRGECISTAAKANPTDEVAKQLAKDECKATIKPGKPAHAGQGKGKGKGNGGGPPGGHPNDKTDDCKGRPPWAGKDAPDFNEQQKAEFHAGCGRGADDDRAEAEAEAREEQQEKDAEAREEQRQAEAEQQAPPAPADQTPADPGAAGNGPPAGDPGAQGQGEDQVELPGPIDAGEPEAGADVEAQDTDPAGD